MSRFHKMVSMERSPEEKREQMKPPSSIGDIPDVPYGLCISLSEVELEKLDLDDECEIGDVIHLFAMARVTSVSRNETTDGTKCRIELSITDLAIEDEDKETEAA